MARRKKSRKARWSGAEAGISVQHSVVRPDAQDHPARHAVVRPDAQDHPAQHLAPGPEGSMYARLAQVPVHEEPAPVPEPRISQRTPGLERLAQHGWTVKKTVNEYSGTTRREHHGYFWTGGAGKSAVKHRIRPNCKPFS